MAATTKLGRRVTVRATMNRGRAGRTALFLLCTAGCSAASGHRVALTNGPALGADISAGAGRMPIPPTAPATLGRPRWTQLLQVATPTQDAVQRALDSAQGSAIVVLPPGHYTIRGSLEIRGQDILLVGSGAGSLSMGSTADSSATVFERAGEEGASGRATGLTAMVHARGVHRAEISGIRFAGTTDPGSTSKDTGVLLEDADEFRVDHCYFSQLGFAGVRVNGASRGVIDHSTFDSVYKPAIGTEGYGVAVYGTDALTGIPMGGGAAAAGTSFAATFVEDCDFSRCRHAVASNKGARYVFRKNHVASGVVAHAVDAHGTEYASAVGTEWIDVYENTIEQTRHESPFYDGWAIRVRGGRGVIHDNVIRGYSTGVELSELTSEKTGPVYVWNNSLEPGGGLPLRANRPGQRAAPAYTLAPPAGYVAHAYPHPLVSTACTGASLLAGSSLVCSSE
jgi:hypothetical protein